MRKCKTFMMTIVVASAALIIMPAIPARGAWTYQPSLTRDDNDGITGGKVDGADFDNDGDLDVVVTGKWYDTGRFIVYENTGNNNFIPIAEPIGEGQGLYNSMQDMGDFDGDGDSDMCVVGTYGTVNNFEPSEGHFSVYRNDGNFNFSLAAMPLTNYDGQYLEFGCVKWGDYDNDGDLDLAASGSDDNNDPRLIIFKNTGANTWIPVAEPLNGGGINGLANGWLAWADFNNDGKPDLVAIGRDVYEVNRCVVLKNLGNDEFVLAAEPVIINGDTTGVINGELCIGDFNSDGYSDIALVGEDGQSVPRAFIYNNNGNFSFTKGAEPMLGDGGGIRYGSIRAGDYDNDGDQDLLLMGEDANAAARVVIYRNDGLGNFTKTAEPLGGSEGLSRGNAVWGDFDNDTDLDFVITGTVPATGKTTHYMFDVYANEIPVVDSAPAPFIVTPDSFYHQTPMVFSNGSGTVSLSSTRAIDTSTLNCITVKEQVNGTLTPIAVNLVFDPVNNKIITAYPFKSGYGYLFQVGANLKTTTGDTLGADTEFCFRVFLPAGGGTVTMLDGDISLTFGNEGMWVTPTVTKSAATDTVILGGVGLFAGDAVFELDVYDTSGNPLNQILQNPVSVVFRLDSLSGAERIGYYNEVTDSWIIVSTADNVDTINNTITVMLTHFSAYAVFSAYALSAISQGQLAFRSLNNPHTSFPVVFRCQSPEAGNYTVEIIDLGSRPVWSTSGAIAANTQTDINWNGQTRSGQTCANGVYYALLRVNGSKPSVWKIMVVR